MGFRNLIRRGEGVQSVTTAEFPRAPQGMRGTEVVVSGERGIGERAEAGLDRLPLHERPEHIAKRIEENIRKLLAEKRDYAVHQAPFLTHVASMTGHELPSDPMMIETRLAIWQQLAVELAEITTQVRAAVDEQHMLETQRSDLFRDLSRHDADVAQATSWLQQIEIKIAREENGVQQPDPLFGKVKDLPDHEEHVTQRQQVILGSPQLRGQLIAAIEQNEIDQEKNKDTRYVAARTVSNFIRTRYNPELARCNRLRAESMQQTNAFINWFQERLQNSQELSGVEFTQQEIEGPVELAENQDETSDVGRLALSHALKDTGILGEILGENDDRASEVLTGSVIEPQRR